MASAIAPDTAFKRGWTLERISQLSVQSIRQLRENAERLHDTAVVALCSAALRGASTRGRKRAQGQHAARTKPRRLIARQRAFEARGVWVEDPRTSWSGLRKSDGAVVMALWADSVELADGGCCCLLWAPSIDGSRPWSEGVAGQERLRHCKRAMELGCAEGLLVYGERSPDHLPEERAFSVYGVDPETVVVFKVEMRGAEFWARWGGKAAS